MLTQERLKELLAYDLSTGWFFWKARRGVCRAGSRAGHLNGRGYRQILIEGKHHSEHRLAWLFVYGLFPDGLIDHRNRVKDDNAIGNLREATHNQNGQNKKTLRNGLKGATRHCHGRWQSQIRVRGRVVYLGLFDSEEDAHAAYSAAARKHHGEFARAE